MTDDIRAVVRLTDLAIISAIAYQRRLLGISYRSHFNGDALHDAINKIALYPLPVLDDSTPLWNSLAYHAVIAACSFGTHDAVDKWVEASQFTDPQRKTRGAYATPMPLARILAAATVRDRINSSRPLRVVDPSAGAGALLIGVLQVLGEGASSPQLKAIVYNLFGVEVDASARELCCLMIWVSAWQAKPSLDRIASNIVVDNAVTKDWWSAQGSLFDVLVMNPPWESLRHSVTETDPQASVRNATVNRLGQARPVGNGLPELYTAQGTGDRNLFKAFLELAPHLLTENGRLGALIPSAFASDLGMSKLRKRYLDQFALERWTSFENLRNMFPIDGRYKFGILTGQRSREGTRAISVRSFATEPHHAKEGHSILTREDLVRLGGPTQMFPELCSEGEALILTQALHHGTPFFDRGALGQVNYRREIDLSFGRQQGLFTRHEDNTKLTSTDDGRFIAEDGTVLVPLIEGRMVGQYDFFQKSWMSGRGRTACWRPSKHQPLSQCCPQFVAPPIESRLARIAICDVTSATNTRTVHATWVPPSWPCGNTAPVLNFENEIFAFAGLAVLNSMVFDWLARRIVGGLHLNKFYLEALVWPRIAPNIILDLAAAAYSLSKQFPRFDAVEGTPTTTCENFAHFEFFPAHVLIETEVARGYGLTQFMLSEMLNDNGNDRRGFWRHFASEPQARAIADQVIRSIA